MKSNLISLACIASGFFNLPALATQPAPPVCWQMDHPEMIIHDAEYEITFQADKVQKEDILGIFSALSENMVGHIIYAAPIQNVTGPDKPSFVINFQTIALPARTNQVITDYRASVAKTLTKVMSFPTVQVSCVQSAIANPNPGGTISN